MPNDRTISLPGLADLTFDAVAASREEAEPSVQMREMGRVTYVGEGIARVSGLPTVQAEELVRFENGRLGMALNLDAHEVGVVLLDERGDLDAGAKVRRTGRILDVPVGDALVGRVVDALGRPLDRRGALRTETRRPVERAAPAIMDRAPVDTVVCGAWVCGAGLRPPAAGGQTRKGEPDDGCERTRTAGLAGDRP